MSDKKAYFKNIFRFGYHNFAIQNTLFYKNTNRNLDFRTEILFNKLYKMHLCRHCHEKFKESRPKSQRN